MIVVTGATGAFGRQVVERLLDRGVPASEIAAVARSADKAADLADRGVQIRLADYDRPDTLVPAFTGADTLLLVSSTGPDDERIRQHRAAVAAAAQVGVGLLVYTSLFRADTSPLGLGRVHRDTETAIADSALPSVLLRNGWYTENYTGTLAGSVERGVIPGSAGDGRIASAARADLAEAAAIVLTREKQAGRVYELTGDTAWSLPELAAATTRQSGRHVSYQDLPPESYAEILTSVGLPDFVVELVVDADVQVSRGALAPVTPDLTDLLGRPTTPLAQTVAEALAR